MNNIRRVWFVDVGQLPADKIDDFINGFKKRVQEAISTGATEVFVPIRQKCQTRVVELDRPIIQGSVGEHAAERTRHFLLRCENASDLDIAEQLWIKVKQKIEDGTYSLQIPGEKPILFIPLPKGMYIETLC